MKRADPFACPIYSFALEDGEWREALLTDIAAWRESDPGGHPRSNRGRAWHSRVEASKRAAFGPLVSAAVDAATRVFRNERYLGKSRVRLGEMWANVIAEGGWHTPHQHGDSLWSGIYYAALPDDAPGVVFRDPRTGVTSRALLADGERERDRHVPAAAAGTMLLFPGWLEHYVEPYMGSEPRVSVSFNVYQVRAPEERPLLPERTDETPHFVVQRGVLTPAQVRRLIAHAEDGAWKPGRVGSDRLDHEIRDSDVLWLDGADVLSPWHDVHVRIMRAADAVSRARFGVDIGGGAQAMQVTRYKAGQSYSTHTDRGGNAPRRALSLSILLRDAAAGGGIRFPDAEDAPPALRPGDAVVFRGDERHEAIPVKQGERLSLVVWLNEREVI